MELVRMKLSELRANAYNPRTRFTNEDLDAFADRLELTPGLPGEPLYPIMAVRDGNVARIVDGERRYRAMKRRGKVSECYVLLFDTMEEASQAVSMMAANDREQFDDVAFSRGCQTCLALGVPEADVDKMAGKQVSRALRSAFERNGNKAVQLSIGQIAAAEEFAEWLAGKLSACGGGIPGSLAPVQMLVADYYQENRAHAVEEFCARGGASFEEWPVSANAWMAADAWSAIDHLNNAECDAVATGENASYYERGILQHVRVMRAMRASHYEPDEDEAGFLSLCEKRVADLKGAGK